MCALCLLLEGIDSRVSTSNAGIQCTPTEEASAGSETHSSHMRCTLCVACCRAKSRAEIAALKSELQKLQLDSKTGVKGKDLALKELETAK